MLIAAENGLRNADALPEQTQLLPSVAASKSTEEVAPKSDNPRLGRHPSPHNVLPLPTN